MSYKEDSVVDEYIDNLLERMPKKVSKSFTDEQIKHLHLALGPRSWKKHPIDVRTTLSMPFVRSQLYLVLLVGRDKRNLTRTEQQVSAFTIAGIATLFLTSSVLLGLLFIYLLKSALGINLSEDVSLGIWDWFKSLF